MKVGDIIIHHDEKFNIIRHWRIDGVYLGCSGQEGLVELRNLTEKPGVPGRTGEAQTTFVPEPLVRMLPVYTRAA